jgi:acid phosphatase
MASLPLEAIEDFTPEQVKSLYPQDLTLQYVQIFFRHGCPLTNSFSNVVQVSGLLSENDFNKLVSLETGVSVVRRMSSVKQLFIPMDNFILCIIIAKSRFLKRTPGSRTSIKVLTVIGTFLQKEGINGSILGELTDQGRVTTLALGQRLRRLYVDELGFLPKRFEDENLLYIRYRSEIVGNETERHLFNER